MLGSQPAHLFQVALDRRDDVDVHHRRLHDQRGDLALEAVEHPLQRLRVVERDRARQVGDRARVAGAVRDAERVVAVAERLERRIHGDHHGVVVAVVGALDLEDHVAPGRAARDVDGVHGRLRARVREAPLRQAEAAASSSATMIECPVGAAKCVPRSTCRLHGRGDPRVCVADAHHSEAVVEVDVLVPVHVPDLRARAALDVDGPGIVLLKRGRDALRHHLAGALVGLARARRALGEELALAGGQLGEAPAIDLRRRGGGGGGLGAHRHEPTRQTGAARRGGFRAARDHRRHEVETVRAGAVVSCGC